MDTRQCGRHTSFGRVQVASSTATTLINEIRDSDKKSSTRGRRTFETGRPSLMMSQHPTASLDQACQSCPSLAMGTSSCVSGDRALYTQENRGDRGIQGDSCFTRTSALPFHLSLRILWSTRRGFYRLFEDFKRSTPVARYQGQRCEDEDGRDPHLIALQCLYEGRREAGDLGSERRQLEKDLHQQAWWSGAVDAHGNKSTSIVQSWPDAGSGFKLYHDHRWRADWRQRRREQGHLHQGKGGQMMEP
jgi:hypothetical protein